MTVPQMARIAQTFDSRRIEDVSAAVTAELQRIGLNRKIKANQQVAVTAGSRGIADIATVLRAAVDFIKSCGARPFVFPAMGSHGGATADGQKRLLAGYGITETSMECPVRSTMDVAVIGETTDGLPVFLDRFAGQADHIVVINRIKPHTKFEGDIESGLMKMMAIGMGKHKGAERYHKASVRWGMGRVIETVGSTVMAVAPVVCGLGLVENGYDQLAVIEAVLPQELVAMEKRLLADARGRMARIPFDTIDLLIVDEMGKNISGTGMDTNVTGVNRDILGTFHSRPETRRLFVRDLSPASEGNALGIGFADVTTTRLVQAIDRKKTYVNCLTGISPEKGAIPMYFDTDRECIAAAFHCLGEISTETLRVVHIRNTLSLANLSVSIAYRPEVRQNPSLKRISDWRPMAFGPDDNLLSPFASPSE